MLSWSALFQLWILVMGVLLEVRSEEDGHHGEEEHWEWFGVLMVDSSATKTYSFEMRNDGSENYTSFRLGIYVTPCESLEDEALHEAEEKALLNFESVEEHNNATQVSGNNVDIYVDRVYEVSYHNNSWLTAIRLILTEDGHFAVFMTSHPGEVCQQTEHLSCFRDQFGGIAPIVFEESHSLHDHVEDQTNRSSSTSWSYTILGCVLCWTMVFCGLLFMVFGSSGYREITEKYIHLLNLFASGAILSTVLLLIVIEAYHNMESSGDLEEAEVMAIFGSSILAGFIAPTLIELMLFLDADVTDVVPDNVVEVVEAAKHNASVKEVQLVNENYADLTGAESPVGMENEPESDENQQKINDDLDKVSMFNSVVISVTCGDFLHNFCDGIFIGVAAKSCSWSLYWAIVFATMFHESAQEISDFVVLTTKGGLPVKTAVLVNAIGGLSILLGGAVVNILDPSELVIGILLAFGSGSLIYLGAAELYPLLHIPVHGKKELTNPDKIKGILSFCLGAAIIGLTLLRHEHCEADGEHAH